MRWEAIPQKGYDDGFGVAARPTGDRVGGTLPHRADDATASRAEVLPNLHVVVPRLPPGTPRADAARLQRDLLERTCAEASVRDPLLWFYTPMALATVWFRKHSGRAYRRVRRPWQPIQCAIGAPQPFGRARQMGTNPFPFWNSNGTVPSALTV